MYVKSKSTVSQLVSESVTRSPIELFWTAKNETKTIFTKVNRKDCGLKSGRKSDKSELENGTLLQTASAIGKKEHVRLLLDYG